MKMFKIPIEEYKDDMNMEAMSEKKKEILDLFTNYNNLGSKEEFDEIESNLHKACSKFDTELIKIYLSKTIKNDSKTLKFKIDQTNQTASLFKVKNKITEVVIPRTVRHESTEYLITSISGACIDIKTIKFVEDSAIETIYDNAFTGSNIEEIYFPSSLKELKKE